MQGFYTREQLELVIQRRTSRKALAELPVSTTIAGRTYQQRAVRKVAEAFEQKERRALLVMATGSGKTRTVIALSDLLIRANWAKRILFLADRIALVNQATNAFKEFLPDSAPVNLVTDKDSEGRVFVSTYPTMMGLINAGLGGGTDALHRFGPGYFDLIVIDEAHRSVYQKYGAIFEYFDSLLVGLTATPKNEIDHNTYGLFGLEDGVPTDSYDLTDAIAEGYLVPPAGRSITTQFVREGIKYADLTAEEKEAWDLLDWADDVVPDEIEPSAMNSWLFNEDTVDKVLEVLMTDGRKVSGGDVLGKTVIFAKNVKHADFIQKRFDMNYPAYVGHFARVIVSGRPYAQNLIDNFSAQAKFPQIAISVDMLDTGIDVPDIVNLVFFKPVHSKTKYWQLVVACMDWILAELCRVFGQVSPEDATEVIASIVTKQVPILEDVDGFPRLLRKLSASNHILVLLYSKPERKCTFSDLLTWVKPTMRSNLRRTLNGLDERNFVHFDEMGQFVSLLIPGIVKVEQEGLLNST